MERLQKRIAASGYTSRRKAEELIQKGAVKVNGQIILELGYKVKEQDEIEVNGELLLKEEKQYFLFYKPRGVISTTKDDKKRKTVLDFFNTEKRIYPIGRLDYDTSGLLLLTNDGEFANLMMHPKHEIDKIYIAKLEGIPTGNQISTLKKGILIDGRKTAPCKIKLKSTDKVKHISLVSITIHEGRYHQVKKMFEAIGLPVIKLKRESFAFLTLDGLKAGEYRKLTPKEVHQLYDLARNKKVY